MVVIESDAIDLKSPIVVKDDAKQKLSMLMIKSPIGIRKINGVRKPSTASNQ